MAGILRQDPSEPLKDIRILSIAWHSARTGRPSPAGAKIRLFAYGLCEQVGTSEPSKGMPPVSIPLLLVLMVRSLASGSWDGTVYVWDARTGSRLHTFKDDTNDVRSIAFRPPEQKLVESPLGIQLDEHRFTKRNPERHTEFGETYCLDA